MVKMIYNVEFRDISPELYQIILTIYQIMHNTRSIFGSYKSSSKPQSSLFGGGMCNFREDHNLQAKFAYLARNINYWS